MAQRKRPPPKISIETQKDGALPFEISQSGTFTEEDVTISKLGLSIDSPAHKREKENAVRSSGSPVEPKAIAISSYSEIEEKEILGHGSSGVVRKALHKPTNTTVAVKTIPIEAEEEKRKKLLRELRTMDVASHKGIVDFLGAFFDNGAVKIVMEYMDGGTLKDIREAGFKIPERVLARLASQCLEAIVYIHKDLHIVHRDIKPCNVLVDSCGRVKISDFGVVGKLENTIGIAQTFAGTVTYMSPERIKGSGHSSNSDIWSLGITLLECQCGWYPYTPPDSTKDSTEITFFHLLEKVEKSPPPLPAEGECSEEFRSFISQCLQKDPQQRPGAAKLLEHPFIHLYDSDVDDVARWMRKTLRKMGKIPKKRRKRGSSARSRKTPEQRSTPEETRL